MARGRRRFQWIDAIQTTEVVLNGAAAPGTIINETILSEAELENVGGGGTLIRVVGDIQVKRTLGTPVITASLFVREAYAGSVSPSDWTADTFQRRDMLGTWMFGGNVNTAAMYRVIDLRTKRKLGQGVDVLLAFQNHSVAGSDATYWFHLRALLMLP